MQNDDLCLGVATPAGNFAPCCAADGLCGLDVSLLANAGYVFSEVCQPKHQLGTATLSCPGGTLSFGIQLTFQGCCRPNGTCGHLVDQVAGYAFELGCVQSASMFDGGVVPPCGP